MAVWKPDFGEYDYVWDFLCGVSAGNPWPEGNEDDLWQLAQEWAAVAQALGDAIQDAGPVVNDLVSAWGGDSGYAFLGLWETLGQSSESGLGAVAEMAGALADMSDHAALELQYNKLTTLITVIITIISVFTALIGAFFTGGGSAAAIQPIMAGGRLAVQQSFRQLVGNIARKVVEKELRKELLKKVVTREALRKLGKEAAEELVEEVLEEVVLVDGLSQALQMASGRRTSWDGSKTAASAIGATAGVPIGMGVAPVARWAKNRAGRLVSDRLSDAMLDRINRRIDRVNSPGTRLGGLGKQFAGTPGQAVSVGLVNAATSPTSSWIANGVVYGNWEYPTDSIMSSALAGASRANTISPPQLAAAALTGGSTGFRETLLGSHPAALDLGVPTDFQPVPSLPDFPATASSTAALSPAPPLASQPPFASAPPFAPESADSAPALSAITSALAPTSAPSLPVASSSVPAPAGGPVFSDVLFSPGGMQPDLSLANGTAIAPPASMGTPGSDATPTATRATVTPLASTSAMPGPSTAPSPASTANSSSSTPSSSPSTSAVASAVVVPGPTTSAAALGAEAPETELPHAAQQPLISRADLRALPEPTEQPAGGTAFVAEPEAANAVPIAPARAHPGRTAGAGGSPSGSSASFQPLRPSTGTTANGTHSYELAKRQGDVDGNLRQQAIDAARQLADAVELTMSSLVPSKNKRRKAMPGTAGALVTRDGVIRTHTSMRGGSAAPHPDLARLLRGIYADLASRGDVPDWHGKCAEVALLSDFLYDFASTYSGTQTDFLAAARSALAGSEIVAVGIELTHSHGAHKNPCISCAQLLPQLNVTAVHAGSTPRRGLPPSIRPTAVDAAKGRLIGRPGGLAKPDPADQRALEDAVPRDGGGRPVRFPNPLGRWLGLVNDGGPAATPFRANNCLDTTLSLLGTWLGNPQVSAPRTAEYAADDTPSTAGETDGRQRAEQTLGADFEYEGADAGSGFGALAEKLRAAGPGASAVLITSIAPGHGGGSHAWNAVNHNGTIHWIDAQIGAVSTEPLYQYAVDGVWSIVLDPAGQPFRAGEPPTVARGSASIEAVERTLQDGAPAAQTVPLSTFVPNGRSAHLPDLVPGELLEAAGRIRPEDFKNDLVTEIDVDGDAVTVRLRDGRSVRFEGVVATDLPGMAVTAVGRNRNVVTVDARVAPEQLTRVWVHEIAAALQEKPSGGFFSRAVARAVAVAALPVGRRAGVDALLEARLSERRYLIRSLGSAESIVSYQELARDLEDLDRQLSEIGVAVRRLPRRPSPAAGLPLTSATDHSRSEPWSDGLDADPTPPWTLEGREPLLDDLVPRTGSDARRLEGAIAAAVGARVGGLRFAGLSTRVARVEVGTGLVVTDVDVRDGAGRSVGTVRFSVGRDASGSLRARLEEFRIDPDVRGGGFATAFTAYLERWYAGSGVSRIEVRAVGAGAYSWARRGFYWGSPSAAHSVLRRLSAERDRVAAHASLVGAWFAGRAVPQHELSAIAAAYPGAAPTDVLADLNRQRDAVDALLTRAQRSSFGSPTFPGPNDVALAGWSGVGREWPGRAALIGAEWEGVRWLTMAPRPDSPAGVDPSFGAPMAPEQMMQPAPPALVGKRAATLRDLGFSSLDDVPDNIRDSVERALAYGIRMVDPAEIAFTQRSISEKTSDRIGMDELIERIGSWHGGPLHGVRWGDGTLVSIDNRRLTAARIAGIDAVPIVAHAPDDGLLDDEWRRDWPRKRREQGALAADVREMPDGSWVLGGDAGRVVHAAGSWPTTFGQFALYRAALGRDLLPGTFFGSRKLPVRVSAPPRRGKLSRDVSLPTELERAIASELAQMVPSMTVEYVPTTSQMLLDQEIDEDYFGAESHEMTPKFAIKLPAGELYGVALREVVQALGVRGYEPLRATSTWGEGNARQGLRTSWRSTHDGQRIDVLLPTMWSARLAEEGPDRQSILAHPGEPVVRKIHVILRQLMANHSVERSALPQGIDPPPSLLADVWENRDDSFAAWVAKLPHVFAEYRHWLAREGWQLEDVITEYGLGESDLPIRAEVREELERQEPDGPHLLRALQELHGRPRTDEHRRPRADAVERTAVEPPSKGLGLRPGSSAADNFQPGQLGQISRGESGGGGGDHAGDHGRGAAAGRGDDSVALPLEGGASGPGSALAPPTDPAGGWEPAAAAGPFAREAPAPSLATTRQYGEGNLRPLEYEGYLDDVREALVTPSGYAVGADPRRSQYGSLINDGGPGRPERDNNCLDCCLAALSSFYGRPEVSVPRWADGQPTGEFTGIERAMTWLGANTWLHHDDTPAMADQFRALHEHVAALGPGSAALVVNFWQAEDESGLLFDDYGYPAIGESHATVVVYPTDADGPVWWDPQEGLTADQPPDWMVSGTVELSYITVEMDGRVNGDGVAGHPGGRAELPGSRRQSWPAVEHAPIPARMGAAVHSGHTGGDRARAAAGQVDLGAGGEHGADNGARPLPATSDHPAVSDGDCRGETPWGSADIPEATAAGSDVERGAPGTDTLGRIGAALLLREEPGGDARTGGRDDAPERPGRPSDDPLGPRPPRLEVHGSTAPGAGPVRGATRGDQPNGGGSAAPGTAQRGASERDGTAPAVPGGLNTDPAAREQAVRSASAVQGVDFEAVASAYDVAARWTAPYLVSAVDRVLQQLNPQATGDVRFLFVTADDTVPWIVGRLAPDFARDHALWVQWPPTPTGWRHLRAQHPSMLITDDPASLPAARPLLPPGTPAGWLVSRLHGPVPDSSALTAAQRSVARAAVVAVVRAAMVAGPADGRAAVYAAAAQLDEAARLRSRAAPAEHGSAPHDPRAAAVLDHRPLDPLLAHWLQQQY